MPQPSQPVAHEKTPTINQGNPESVAGIEPKDQNNNELIKAQEIVVAALDPVHNGDSPEDDDGSDSDDIQFPQDVLFTNANSSKKDLAPFMNQQQFSA